MRGKFGEQLWQRAALSLALAALPLLGERIPLPGVDLGGPLFTTASATKQPWLMSVMALGMAPILSAFLTVEYASLLVPPLRRLRNEYPNGRARLRRAVTVLALILAAFQGFFVSMAMARSEGAGIGLSVEEMLLPTASMVGSTCILLLATAVIDQLGVLSGVMALQLVSSGNRLPQLIHEVPPAPDALHVAGRALAVALPILATWLVCVGSQRPKQRGPWLSAPLSSAQPTQATLALLAFPLSMLSFVDLPDELFQLIGGEYRLPLTLALGALITLTLAFLLNEPRRVRIVAGRVDSELSCDASAVRGQWWSGLVTTLLYVACLFAAEELATQLRLPTLAASTVAFATAFSLDALRSLQFLAKQPTWVRVWEERRPYVAQALIGAAAREGLALQATNLAQTSLLRIFGPWVGIGLWCAPENTDRVRELLAESLKEANAPLPKSKHEEPQTGTTRTPVTWSRSENLLLGALLAGAAASLWLISPRAQAASQPLNVSFEIALVDDSKDRFNLPESDLPPGLARRAEGLRGRDSDYRTQHYVRLVPVGGESLKQADARLASWIATLDLAPGERLLWQRLEDADDKGQPVFDGYRSYIVTSERCVTSGDVRKLTALGGNDGEASVSIQLSPEAGERFRMTTAAHVHERLAILVGGEVESAPVVMSEIKGGKVTISVGHFDDQASAQSAAERMLARLTSR